jgi:outer membrane protein assembly factor BamB
MSDAVTQYQGVPGHPHAQQAGIVAPAAVVTPVRPRLWPAMLLIVVWWALLLLPSRIPTLQGTPLQLTLMFFGGIVVAALMGLWLLFASRIPWTDRLLLLLFVGTSGLAAAAISHPTFVMMGYGPIVRGLPLAMTALVAWLLITPVVSWPVRRLGAVVACMLGWGYCDLVRLDGVWGNFEAEINWRWTPTDEDTYAAYLAGRSGESSTAAREEKELVLRPGDWPGFRGPNRDNWLKDVRIATDWNAHPPKLLWKHRVGPGWSSFAVIGDRAYTQEQRGEQEAVVCIDAKTGEELWAHTDPVRFNETIGGPGPRSTPTFYEGKLYTLGAKGTLNCLDPLTGKVKWSRDIVADSGAKVPIWGFSSSPLVSQGVVTVFAGGPNGKSVLGYQASSGELAWAAGDGKDGYCSTQLSSVDGTDQLLIVANKGLTSFEPAGGKVLWSYEWTTEGPPRVAQPTLVTASDVLLATPLQGMRRLHVTHEGDTWEESQVWETKDIKPYYNDLVVYKDHVYGFDGTFFTCVKAEDGKSKWRARGYGAGQVLLLPDQGLLLISTEKGEVALVEATPERHIEIAKFKAIEGKTWNHPVLSNGKLFVRNGEEAACFQIPKEGTKDTLGDKAQPEKGINWDKARDSTNR